MTVESTTPPLEKTKASERLFVRAQEIAAGLGLTLKGGKTGGGSDASIAAGLGIPALDGLGAGQPLDFIIGAVLEPNREVKESFEAIEITTKDGETYQGYRIRADKNELVLRDVTLNKEVRLRRDQIADQQNRGSVMPAGLVDHLTRQELRDLFRYLSELGKAER